MLGTDRLTGVPGARLEPDRARRRDVRRPTLIIGFWAVVAVVDAYWIFALGQRLPNV